MRTEWQCDGCAHVNEKIATACADCGRLHPSSMVETIPGILDEIEARLYGDDALTRADRDALASKLHRAHQAMENIVDAARGAQICTVRHEFIAEALRDWPGRGLKDLEPVPLNPCPGCVNGADEPQYHDTVCRALPELLQRRRDHER